MIHRLACTLALLALLAPPPARAAGTTETLLSRVERATRLESRGDLSGALDELDAARADLIRRINLRLQDEPIAITGAALCRQASRAGDPIPFGAPPEPGKEICLVVEASGFNVAAHPSGGFVHHVTLEGKVVDAKGRETLAFGPIRQFVNDPVFSTRTRLVKYLRIPKETPRGDYRLRFAVADQLTGEPAATGEISFRVGKVITLGPFDPEPSAPKPVKVNPPVRLPEFEPDGEPEVETGE